MSLALGYKKGENMDFWQIALTAFAIAVMALLVMSWSIGDDN